jgi:N-acetylglucosamine kinase-like BadF-type ATPase
MSNYIIGIDGGGTSTDGAIFTEEGRILKQVTGDFANFRVDSDLAKHHLMSVLDQLLEGINRQDIQMIQLGISGVPSEEEKDKLTSMLSERYQCVVDMTNDAMIALYSIRKGLNKCVVMILGGTGSAIMIGVDDQAHLIGGFGHLLGDEGSAYHLAITALKNIIKAREEGKKDTPLTTAILSHINAKDHYQIKDFVYNTNKQDIASLSRFLSEYAINGDNEAIELFKLEGHLLADQTLRGVSKFQTCSDIIIGLRGSFLLHAPYVKDTLLQRLDDANVSYKIDLQPIEPIYGAYYLALQKLKSR